MTESEPLRRRGASGVTGTVSPLEVIVFYVGLDEFCLPVAMVREIRVWSEPTPLPRADPAILGVINLRGTILPVLDLALRLGCGSDHPAGRKVIIVTEDSGRVAGLAVSRVTDILSVDPAEIVAPPATSPIEGDGFVMRLSFQADRFLRILDLGRLMPAGMEADR